MDRTENLKTKTSLVRIEFIHVPCVIRFNGVNIYLRLFLFVRSFVECFSLWFGVVLFQC